MKRMKIDIRDFCHNPCVLVQHSKVCFGVLSHNTSYNDYLLGQQAKSRLPFVAV